MDEKLERENLEEVEMSGRVEWEGSVVDFDDRKEEAKAETATVLESM